MTAAPARTCGWGLCGASLAGRRKDARFCGPPCKADAHRHEPRQEAFWRGLRTIRRSRPPRRP